MATVMFPLDAVAGSPAYASQAIRQAFSAFLGIAPTGRPLGAISGVRPGTPSTTVNLSGAGSMTWNVAAHSGVLDTQTSAAAGPYCYATDGTDSGAVTAANASNPRIDLLYVKVNDNVQDGSALESGQVLYLAGVAASTPSAPATPARGMAIAQISVPTSGSGAPTISWVAPTFGLRPWVDCALGSGFSHASSAEHTQWASSGGVVTVAIAANKATILAGDVICTIPVPPTRPLRDLVRDSGSSAQVPITINTNGTIVASAGASTGLFGTITFVQA